MTSRFLIPGMLFASVAIMPEALLAASKCDLQPYIVKSPCARPRTTQGLLVTVYNSGDVASGAYTVGIKVNGELVAETHVDEGIERWDEIDVAIDGSVTLEYGKSYQVEAYVNTDVADANPSNNTMCTTVKMPAEPAPNYPYIWNDATCQSDFDYETGWWSMGWGFDSDMKAFYISERASNWMGSLSTHLPITFAEGEAVTCSFDYGTSGAPVKLVLAEKCQYHSEPVAEKVLAESPYDFSHATISFIAPGPMAVDFQPELLADLFTYGSFFIRNICFTPAVSDMEATAILSPQFPAIALSDAEIPVTVRYTNPGLFDIEHPVFSYSFDGHEVSEAYEGVLTAGSSIDYTFRTPIVTSIVTPGTELKAWCEAEADSDADNNSVATTFCVYEAIDFPYVTSFLDDDLNLPYWSTLDLNGDQVTWSFDYINQYNGPVLLCDYGKFSDYLIMPAIELPQGRCRLTFGYWDLFAASRLRVLMGRTPSVAGMTEVLCDYDLVGSQAGYALIDIEEPGIYYIAFEGSGSADELLITDVALDQGDGVVVNGIQFDAASGYNLTTSSVSIQLTNRGISEQSSINVFYQVDNRPRVEEVIDIELLPGELFTYTFSQLADVSAYGTHRISGGVIPALGDDEAFTTVQGVEISNYEALSLPYSYGFDDEERNTHWVLQAEDDWWGDGWQHESNFYANSHHADISGSYSGTDPYADFWAFSEGVFMPAGEYEVAFYYRGRSYFGGRDYVQNLDVALGQGAEAEAMTVPVTSIRNFDSHGCYFDRFVAYVTVPEDGVWNIGFHDVSPSNYGQTRVDDVSIRAIEPGLALPYVSQFSDDAEAQWTFHGNDTYFATQWGYTSNGALRCRHDGNDGIYFENLATSPKLAVEPGREVTVSIKYSVNPISGPRPDLKAYLGKFDSMKQMSVVATLPASDHEAEFTFTADDADGIYLGLRSDTDISEEDDCDSPLYTITIQSVEVRYTQSDGIEQLPAEAAVTRSYNLMGQPAARGQGIRIIRGQGAQGVKVLRR